jgi:hypothetical protein
MMSMLSRSKLAARLAQAAALAFFLGGRARAGESGNTAALLEKAKQIHSRILAFDSHVDIPLNYGERGIESRR